MVARHLGLADAPAIIHQNGRCDELERRAGFFALIREGFDYLRVMGPGGKVFVVPFEIHVRDLYAGHFGRL